MIVSADVLLMPLMDSLDELTMTECARFLSLQLREPGQHLTTVTLTADWLVTCPEVELTTPTLYTDIMTLTHRCPTGTQYDQANFMCMDGIYIDLYLYSFFIVMLFVCSHFICQQISQTHDILDLGMICANMMKVGSLRL